MRQTVERVKSGVLMKDILDCYPGIGTYVQTHSDCLLLFCSVLFWTFLFYLLLASIPFTHSSPSVPSIVIFYIFFYFPIVPFFLIFFVDILLNNCNLFYLPVNTSSICVISHFFFSSNFFLISLSVSFHIRGGMFESDYWRWRHSMQEQSIEIIRSLPQVCYSYVG